MLLLGLVYHDHVLTGLFMKMLVVGALTVLTMATAAGQGTRVAKDVLLYYKLAPKEPVATEASAKCIQLLARSNYQGCDAQVAQN
jgi:hypothetical protein